MTSDIQASHAAEQIEAVLLNGPKIERDGMLRIIEIVGGKKERDRIQRWVKEQKCKKRST